MQTPSVGRIVHVLVDPNLNNGAYIAPAIITRVWSESGPGRWTVNYRIIFDNSDHAIPNTASWKTSAFLFDDEDAAMVSIDERAKHLAGDDRTMFGNAHKQIATNGMHAFWPPRA